jgi:hypothetical protein
MKVSFNLEPQQRLILRILHDTGKIHYPILERVVDALDQREPNLGAVLKAFANEPKPLDFRKSWEKPKLAPLERTLEGLIFVGLVSRSRHRDNQFLIGFSADQGLTDDDIELTAEGKRVAVSIKEGRLLTLRPVPIQRTTVFVACAFGHGEIDTLCERQFVPACTAIRYEAVRVDLTEPKRSITNAILEGITECACVIADLSYARPSVYFEVGLAHGLGVPILLTCKSDHHRGKRDDRRVHFDLEQYKISFWRKTEGGTFQWSKNMKPAQRLSVLLPNRRDAT